jgi:hypothetical protein
MSNEIWIYGNATCVTKTLTGGKTWQAMPGFLTRIPDIGRESIPFGYDGASSKDGWGVNTTDGEDRYGNLSVSCLHIDPQGQSVVYYCTEETLYRYQFDATSGQGHAVNLKALAADVRIDELNHLALYTDTGKFSLDGGWTWIDKSKQLAKICGCDNGERYITAAKLLSFHGGELRALIVARGDAFNGYPGDVTIIRSQDMGDTWNVVERLKAHGLVGGPFINSADSANIFIAVQTAQGTPGVLGTSYKTDSVKVLETKDGGKSWNEVYSHAAGGQFQTQGLVRGVAQVKSDTGRSLLLATREGLLKSDDEGTNWKKLGGIQ